MFRFGKVAALCSKKNDRSCTGKNLSLFVQAICYCLHQYQAELIIILFTSFISSSLSIGFRIDRFLSIA